MNIQQILDENPDDYAYKILKPHQRTINTKFNKKCIDFQYPTLFIVKLVKNCLHAAYFLQIHNNQFYQLTHYFDKYLRSIYEHQECSEFCMPVNFYQLNFENKDDCLNQAIDVFFNSSFESNHIESVNKCYEPVQKLNKPYFRRNHFPREKI